jgi:hypothetical protein
MRDDQIRQYVAGYLARPESSEEIDESTAIAVLVLVEQPWD